MHSWEKRKAEYMERIERDREIGYLDPGIDEILRIINSREKSYTTSSCTGRISAVDAVYPWKREEETPVFKKHDFVTAKEIRELMKIVPRDILWLIASGPILHICCRDLEEAGYFLQVARQSGFKHSGIMSFSEDCFMVELISGTQLFIPLRSATSIFISEDSIEELLSLLNGALSEGRRRLERLKVNLGGRG